MRLQTDRLLLRPWTDADGPAYAALQSDPHVRRFYPSVLTPEQAGAELALQIEKQTANPFHFLAAELRSNGDFVGLVGISKLSDVMRQAIPSHPEVEIGWVLNRAFWGQGIAPEAARACLDYAWTLLGLPEIVAFTAHINRPSQSVMEKIGMRRTPEDDFAHPRIAPGHPLHAHVVYRIVNPN